MIWGDVSEMHILHQGHNGLHPLSWFVVLIVPLVIVVWPFCVVDRLCFFCSSLRGTVLIFSLCSELIIDFMRVRYRPFCSFGSLIWLEKGQLLQGLSSVFSICRPA